MSTSWRQLFKVLKTRNHTTHYEQNESPLKFTTLICVKENDTLYMYIHTGYASSVSLFQIAMLKFIYLLKLKELHLLSSENGPLRSPAAASEDGLERLGEKKEAGHSYCLMNIFLLSLAASCYGSAGPHTASSRATHHHPESDV